LDHCESFYCEIIQRIKEKVGWFPATAGQIFSRSPLTQNLLHIQIRGEDEENFPIDLQKSFKNIIVHVGELVLREF
jgi:hypothetical protein